VAAHATGRRPRTFETADHAEGQREPGCAEAAAMPQGVKHHEYQVWQPMPSWLQHLTGAAALQVADSPGRAHGRGSKQPGAP